MQYSEQLIAILRKIVDMPHYHISSGMSVCEHNALYDSYIAEGKELLEKIDSNVPLSVE